MSRVHSVVMIVILLCGIFLLTMAIGGSGRPALATGQGVITEYAIPTAGSRPIDIIKGPDGRLWFTEASAKKIGRIGMDLPNEARLPVVTRE